MYDYTRAKTFWVNTSEAPLGSQFVARCADPEKNIAKRKIMKFHLGINLDRMDDSTDMTQVRDHTLEMVQMADRAGFEIVWAAKHHALEMTIAPNPFQLLS